MALIEIRNLKKHFASVKAVDGIDLTIDQGEIFGFLGPNGAGKTTTIRAMMDFIHPDSGTITLGGLDSPTQSDQIKKFVGFIPSEENLFDSWSGEDHFELSQALYGASQSLKELVNLFNFDSKRKVHQLSTGNRRKLSIILALMHRPRLLIADEATNGLDPLLQSAFYQIIRNYVDKGMTVFMSSHNLAEVEKICNRVSIIKQGRIISTEKISELKKRVIYRAEAIFGERVKSDDFKIEGVSVEQPTDYQLTFRIKGDVNSLTKALSNRRLEALEVTHAPLEEIFLEYYKDKDD